MAILTLAASVRTATMLWRWTVVRFPPDIQLSYMALVRTPDLPAEARSAAMWAPTWKIPWLIRGSTLGLTGSWNGGTKSRAPRPPIWCTS